MGLAERVRRYVVLAAGVFVISCGVSFLTKAGLGTSPISVIPYTLSLLLPQLSYGTYVALFNGLLVVLEVLIMGRDSDLVDIVQQLVLCALFGTFVDLAMAVLAWCQPDLYPVRLLTMLAGIACLAFGAWLELICHVGMMAGDAFCRALARPLHAEFGRTRVISDSTMAGIATVMNVAAFARLVCVREGTIVTALLTGTCISFFSAHLGALERLLVPQNFACDQGGEA